MDRRMIQGDLPQTPITALEFVRERIREGILRGEFPPGSRLPQADVAQRLGVSITPVREAMRGLATEGLLVLDNHRGAVVAAPSREEAQQIWDLRRLIEPYAIQVATSRITDRELDAAEALHARMLAETDFGSWAMLNRRFHEVLAHATGSPRMVSVLQSLRDAASIYVAISIKKEEDQRVGGNEDHGDLVAALRERDVERAVEITVRHLGRTVDAIPPSPDG